MIMGANGEYNFLTRSINCKALLICKLESVTDVYVEQGVAENQRGVRMIRLDLI